MKKALLHLRMLHVFLSIVGSNPRRVCLRVGIAVRRGVVGVVGRTNPVSFFYYRLHANGSGLVFEKSTVAMFKYQLFTIIVF